VLNKAKPVLTFYHCVMLQSTSFYKKYFNHFGMMIIVIVLTIALIVVVIKLYDQRIEEIKQANIKQITSCSFKNQPPNAT
jgi:flagellar biogenesis protein FliO